MTGQTHQHAVRPDHSHCDRRYMQRHLVAQVLQLTGVTKQRRTSDRQIQLFEDCGGSMARLTPLHQKSLLF